MSEITSEVLIEAIRNLSTEDKDKVRGMLNNKDSIKDSFKDNFKDNFKEITEKENKELENMITSKKRRMYNNTDGERYATSADVMSLRSKIDALQLDMIDMMRHMKEYTQRYMEVAKKPMIDGLTNYVEQLTQTGNIMNRVDEAKEDAKEKETEDQKTTERGLFGNVFDTMKSTASGVLAGANDMLNNAAEKGSDAINNLIPAEGEEEPNELNNTSTNNTSTNELNNTSTNNTSKNELNNTSINNTSTNELNKLNYKGKSDDLLEQNIGKIRNNRKTLKKNRK
jgi:hypothetical protein